jgi:hypothetical protein
VAKVFCFFFSKKQRFLLLGQKESASFLKKRSKKLLPFGFEGDSLP